MTTITDRLRDNKAVHTVAGAGDLAVEKIREMPDQVTKIRETVDRYQGEVRGNVVKIRGEVRDNVTKLQSRVDASDLPGAAVAYVTHFGARTVEVIDDLAERGKKVMTRVERQAATQQLEESAKRTKSRAKATTTEAKKTARAAQRATGDAAKKVGD
ncbi:hypothetical protein DPM19_30450 [Actinomadura craniellae]|uniref:Uncharacterized protein n=1 Tax=Actinomadura craniellae TaxID=2231787 RepID=A0A365GWY9_9ACTN|nr:hypothetical protein [Actinomadura craniellae]RAY11347.1 hypothetical protein DPM19_30450 [Actinomadura craniellae]